MWSLKKFTSAYLFQIEREKSCDYVLITYMMHDQNSNNDIFTSLRRNKVLSPAKQFKELFSLVCYFFALN